MSSRAGGRALRRAIRRAVRRVRRLRAVDARIRVGLEPAAPAPRRHRRGDRRRGRVAHVAARSTQSGRHAPWLAEGAAFRTPLDRLPAPCGGDRRRRAPLGASCVERSGALVEVTTPDGFRVLQVDRSVLAAARSGRAATRPSTSSWSAVFAAGASSARRRTPSRRTSSSTTRRSASSPALRPRTLDELAEVKGFGPVKLERYGDDLLAVLAATP